MNKISIALNDLEQLASLALTASNTHPDNAAITAKALVAADADGLASHGVSRIPFYADQALSGKVNGHAVPLVEQSAAAVVKVDAAYGFAYPAIQQGLKAGLDSLEKTGIRAVSIYH